MSTDDQSSDDRKSWVPLRRSTAAAVCWVVGIVWLLLLGGDWFMRFHWFRWQDSLILQPAAPSAQQLQQPVRHRQPARYGGDLTKLVGIPSFAARYEQEHPADDFWIDEYGFCNRPPTTNAYFPLVVIGDSYMRFGATMDTSFPSLLEQRAGARVYNFSAAGRGSFWSVIRYMNAERFKERPPRIVLWGIIEREIAGSYFAGFISRVVSNPTVSTQEIRRARFDWRDLTPSRLKKALPNTSVTAQLAARFWTILRYYLFGKIHEYVVVADGQVNGRPMLFYKESLDAMRWSKSFRDLDKVVEAIRYPDEMCRAYGIKLVVVLIPDKEQVYREHVPVRYLPLPDSCLDELGKKLGAAGIDSINLLEPFREHAAQGELLYWADDTHWNQRGIEIAADQVWPRIEPLLKTRLPEPASP